MSAAGRTETLKGVKLDRKKYGLIEDTARLAAVPGETGTGLSFVQIDAILELQLHRLTRLSVDEILKELAEIRDLIAELKSILASEKKLKGVIITELREVQKDYADPRRTQIVESVEEIKLEDLIADVDMAITVSHAGYIKRTPVDVYRHQSRGGKGRIGAKTREDDFVEYLFVASAHSYILLFSSKGRVYWLKVYELPEAAAATRGKAISSLVKFQEDEHLTAVVAARNLEEEGTFIFFATRNGTVKKTALNEFSNPRSTGIIAINLEKDDELIGAHLTDGKQMIFLASHDGQANLFRETDYNPQMFVTFPMHYDLAGLTGRFINVGLWHQSNGSADPASRSWNRVYAQFGFERGDFALYVRPWIRIREPISDDDNHDIIRYEGYGDITGIYKWGHQEFSLLARLNGGNYGLQGTWDFPIGGRIKGYVKATCGYSETLIDYNWRQNTFGVGVLLVDWL